MQQYATNCMYSELRNYNIYSTFQWFLLIIPERREAGEERGRNGEEKVCNGA